MLPQLCYIADEYRHGSYSWPETEVYLPLSVFDLG
jgi:hypothetical protein